MTEEKCFHHAALDSEAQCKVCGKFICKDCREMYGMESGLYAGESLCYECVSEMNSDTAGNIRKFRDKVVKERLVSIVGAVAGLFISTALSRGWDETGEQGLNIWIAMLIGILVGGSIIMLPEAVKAFKNGDAAWGVLCIVGAPVLMIKTHLSRRNHLKQCVEIATADTDVMRKMRDYFAYFQFMEKNKDADLTKLTANNGKLNGNTYANDVLEKGEDTARMELRRGIVQIGVNSETIKDLGERKKKIK